MKKPVMNLNASKNESETTKTETVKSTAKYRKSKLTLMNCHLKTKLLKTNSSRMKIKTPELQMISKKNKVKSTT